MLNFEFHNPTRILFGKGQISNLKKYIPKDKVIVMTYGFGSIKKNTVYDQVKSALDGYDVREFSGIEPNPEYDTLVKCVNMIKEIGVDKVFLLAVGGGSVIDGTKFIAIASYYTHSNNYLEIFDTNGQYIEKALPLASVLTLPASGSEMNSALSISCRALNIKPAIFCRLVFPVVSVLDPSVTLTLPTRQTTNGIIDTIAHIFERYASYPVHADVQDRFCEGLMRVLIDNGKILMENPNDMNARANVMWASTQATNTNLTIGVPFDGSSHFVGMEITAYLGMDHGATLAISIPRICNLCFENKKEKLAQMAERVFDIKEGTIEEKARACIRCLVDFFENTLHVPTNITAYNGEYSLDQSWIEKCYEKNKAANKIIGEHKDITPENVRDILYDCYKELQLN